MKTDYRIGTRKSKLAQIQADYVIARLQEAYPDKHFERVLLETRGDLDRKTDLVKMGGQGVFVKAIQEALLTGEIDMAVHSAKDLPSVEPLGLTLGAFPQRMPVGDSLILRGSYDSLADLPTGAVVGTSSRRRRFQLGAQRPDLKLVPLRGNIDTRLDKLASGEYDGIIMAQAGLRRYGLPVKERGLTEFSLPETTFLPAVGQGAIAVECRENAVEAELLQKIDDLPVRQAVTCERAFLAVFGLGCNVPLAGYARYDKAEAREKLLFTGQLGDEATGKVIEIQSEVYRHEIDEHQIMPEMLGKTVAEKIRKQADFLPK